MSDRQQRANAIRALAMDAVEKANSGHPGMPMGMADIAEVLWHDFLVHNPANPNWVNRDRFVLSNGHGSMLLYALLHLTGYDLSIDDLKAFRQWHSKTPGHPEYGHTPGVETTTGPLGQGIAAAVGMALAEKRLAEEFNQADFMIVDHHTYCFLGDGCLMEGISHEACSLAGVWQLGKLIAFWDDNGISIDGDVSGWFTDNTAERFRAYGWHVIEAIDGHDAAAIKAAIEAAKQNTVQPTLICCKTVIGWGSPNKAGSAKSHGAALGDEEIKLTKEKLNWPYAPFEIPDALYQQWSALRQGEAHEATWNAAFEQYQAKYPVLAEELTRRITQQLPKNFDQAVGEFIKKTQAEAKTMATRKAQQQVLDFMAPLLPELLGGSADLTGSNNTKPATTANYIHYGVREFGMTAIMNGITLHRGFRPYGGTFLVFSDYAKNAVRVAALMQQPVIFAYSHDSIGLGEDGPTHQPVEQLASLRLIPGLNVWRPCDVTEMAVAWRFALENTDKPSAIISSRQDCPHQARDEDQVARIARGGYVLLEPASQPKKLIMATGSEVGLAMEAATRLNAEGDAVRVVSMPCVEVFLQQDRDYQQQVLPDSITKRCAIEAGSTNYWYQWVGREGCVIGIDHFGASAPAEKCFAEFGFAPECVMKKVKQL